MPEFIVMFPADDEAAWLAATAEQRQATYDTDVEFVGRLRAAGGSVTGGAALGPSAGVATLRRDPSGDALVTDGPFAETAEQLSGFYVVQASGRDAVVEAARVLLRAHPVVEVRPVDED